MLDQCAVFTVVLVAINCLTSTLFLLTTLTSQVTVSVQSWLAILYFSWKGVAQTCCSLFFTGI